MSSSSLSCISRKKPRLETALSLQDFRGRLQDVDESNMEDLLALKKSLDAIATETPMVTLIPAAVPAMFPIINRRSIQDSVPTIAAAKLTRTEVFTFFVLKNTTVKKWGRSGYDIPVFDLPSVSTTPSACLTEALEMWGVVFGRNNEPDIRTYFNLILMDVLRDVQRFQADGVHNSETRTESPPEKPVTPTVRSSKNVLRILNEVRMSTMLEVHGKQIRIVGHFDIGFSHGDRRADSITPVNCLNDLYLALLQIKGVRCDIESAFNQLLVYLAMVQRARLEKLKKHQVKKGNFTVYGVLSDGDKLFFVYLDNGYKVSSWNVQQLLTAHLTRYRFGAPWSTIS